MDPGGTQSLMGDEGVKESLNRVRGAFGGFLEDLGRDYVATRSEDRGNRAARGASAVVMK